MHISATCSSERYAAYYMGTRKAHRDCCRPRREPVLSSARFAVLSGRYCMSCTCWLSHATLWGQSIVRDESTIGKTTQIPAVIQCAAHYQRNNAQVEMFRAYMCQIWIQCSRLKLHSRAPLHRTVRLSKIESCNWSVST